MFKRLSEQDHYQVLEISYGATVEEIRDAYETAREIYQLDSLVSSSILSPEERRVILERITEAYNALIAEESRRLYDQKLAESSAELREMLAARPSPFRPPAVNGGASPAGGGGVTRVPLASRPTPGPKPNLSPGEEASGRFLRRAREALGLDLRSIAEETKISSTVLAYIEEERIDRLPAPVYLRSFVGQFARCLGLEGERVASSYLARVNRLRGAASP